MKDEAREATVSMLYVEDEADARQMVTRMLTMNYPNLTIYSADNGAQALELYRQHAPEIVMTDINMPVMDGIRMSREIKGINPDVNIIAVTAHSDTSYLLSAIEIGVHNYVLKPLNYQELFGVLDKVLEQIHLKRLVSEQHRRLARSERQLTAAQRIAHLGSWQLNLETNAMEWSKELYCILGLELGAAPPSYQAFIDSFHSDDREHVVASLHQDVLDVQDVQEPQPEHRFYRVLRPDGSLRIVGLEVEVSRETGAPLSLIGTCHDVTELKQAEQQIRSLSEGLERRVLQRTSLLQATVSELENFSYFVSHDLRAPVARLEGFCTALLEDCGVCGNANCRQYATRAGNVVQQIKQIMDAFNSLTHLARCTLHIEETNLSALADEIAFDLSRGEPGRRMEIVIADGARVKGDRDLLKKAMQHLLQNAWKFTSKNEHGRMEFGWFDRQEQRVYFVRDNGAGFNMKYAEKLFQPFQTIHTPGEFPGGGAGIGLATVHSIVLRHGGRIWAEGEVGKGATFYFTLEANPESGSYLKEA